MADMLLTCLVKVAVYWPLWFFFFFLRYLHSVSVTHILRLSMLILKNCGEERKIVRVGTPGQRPVISRKAL